ncbi:hypothetical protein GGR88_001287 [Sphingomonas jejuensis]|uniref:Uncharacterized protein n=1 Tax=Sphingomonas jejuensis TaxID=904715 RepID=A0ABX0XKE2_9SPHN|nr:hypothetical protein [Sphingomonas jejuensis]
MILLVAGATISGIAAVAASARNRAELPSSPQSEIAAKE